ncbi:cytochrome c-type biogenesis protein CcmH [Pseudomonas aeruginosa]|nr:cytochrome c-type biogenesis protein CcmH [Pseudomonas aeruginosa]
MKRFSPPRCSVSPSAAWPGPHRHLRVRQRDAERERFRNLTQELRCPKCQNQDIADSNAPIAATCAGRSTASCSRCKATARSIDHTVARYGDFVRQPPVNERTWLLWFGPAPCCCSACW